MKNLKKLFVRGGSAVAVGAALVVSQSASAAGWDYSSLTSDVDFSTIATSVLAVAALLATVYAGIRALAWSWASCGADRGGRFDGAASVALFVSGGGV
ncbi:hypothetical protein [Pseudomonas aeruginosa]|uniref:hypothetical protein n=1 Tax=Pseudomonas aeruginosa TaxID=287 RepID=UPI0021B3DEFC|nr:hypothetical protein [Pseudomonas aeruginosa]MCT7418402.1 hypothetical protein [Pseudomonas aeruginosa]